MKLEHQVCSLDLAKRLKELRAKQESTFCWIENDIARVRSVGFKTKIGFTLENGGGLSERIVDHANIYAAFTVAELLPQFPMHHNFGAPQVGKVNDGTEYMADMIHWYNLWHDRGESEKYRLPPFKDENPANALAKMLIYLIENKLVAA